MKIQSAIYSDAPLTPEEKKMVKEYKARDHISISSIEGKPGICIYSPKAICKARAIAITSP